jgi:hypothetical protein
MVDAAKIRKLRAQGGPWFSHLEISNVYTGAPTSGEVAEWLKALAC